LIKNLGLHPSHKISAQDSQPSSKREEIHLNTALLNQSANTNIPAKESTIILRKIPHLTSASHQEPPLRIRGNKGRATRRSSEAARALRAKNTLKIIDTTIFEFICYYIFKK